MLLKSQWPELRLRLKVSAIVGMVVGGIGSLFVFSYMFLLLQIEPHDIFWQLLGVFMLLFVFGGPLALLSSLALTLLRLTDQQNKILGIISLTLSPPFVIFVLWVFLSPTS